MHYYTFHKYLRPSINARCEMTTQLNTRVCLLVSGFFFKYDHPFIFAANTRNLPNLYRTGSQFFSCVYLRSHTFSGANTNIVFVQFKIIYVRTIAYYIIMVYRVHLKSLITRIETI